MARLPDYRDLGETPVPRGAGGVVGYQPHDSRGFGAGITQAGQDLEAAAGILAETNARQDQMVAEAAVNRLQAHRLELEAGEAGFDKVRGAGAVGPDFLKTYQQKFSDIASAVEQSLTNDHQRQLFQQRAPVAALSYRSALLRHQAVETDRFNEQTEADTIDLARREIFVNPLDAQALDGGLARINWAIDQRAQRKGWDKRTVDDTKATYREKVFEDVAAIMVERDPAGALVAMNKRMGIGMEAGPSGVTAIDALGPDKLVGLRVRAASYTAQAENRLKAEAEKRDREAEQEAKGIEQFALSGQMVSPVEAQRILGKVAGTRWEAPVRATIAASNLGAVHGSLTLPQQVQQLRAIDARVAAQGSSEAEKKLIDTARTITATQQAAYKENPWAAATRFNRQPPVPEVQITAAEQVPKLVAERLLPINGVEVAAGVPVSPLQPAEAQAFAEKLRALPPDARAEVLGQTGAMLNAPRAEALADQLGQRDKPLGLALKMGLDRTTAGRTASALVLRGAQALADKTVKKDDAALSGWRADIAAHVRGTLGDDQAEQDVIDAAYYVRAAQDVEGIGGPDFARGIGSGAPDAIAMVLGKPLERAGVKTFMPRGVQTEGDFDLKLRAVADTMRARAPAGQIYLRGVPVKVEQFANHVTEYGMRFAGRGRYVPTAKNAPFTLDAAGQQPLVLELK